MTASVGTSPGTPLLTHRQRLTVLLALFVACVVSTAAHYTHNFIQIEHYPQASYASNGSVRIAIVLAWPLLTATGLLGVWLYVERRYTAALAPLAAYSVLGLVTLGHFTAGNPHIPVFWYATIFIDGILGLAILAFAYWSAVTPAAVHAGEA